VNWRRNSSSSFHVDQHAMAWDPWTANRVYIGNDGGVYRSSSNGSLTGNWTKSTRQTSLQFYTVAVSTQDLSRISGGLQDNGSVRSWGGTNWNSIGGGDGLANLIDPTNGGNRLNRSTNSAASFTVISPDLSSGQGGTGDAPFGTITTVAVAHVGDQEHRFHLDGDHRRPAGPLDDPAAVDPTDANLVYATVSGFRNGETLAHVFRSANGGASWVDISSNMPDSPHPLVRRLRRRGVHVDR
jgi:hypothetical protein